MERGFPESTCEALQARGHRVKWLDDWTFPCQLTAIKYLAEDRVLEGGTDVRGERWGIAW
jgi:gamma-glutamyltranspeptidase